MVYWKGIKLGNDWMLGVMAIAGILQPKGTKCPSKTTKSTKKKPVSSKKATPKPSPKPSPEKSPTHSTEGEKSDGSLTYHSFYNLASDEEPIKKKRSAQKSPPKDKSPAHEEHHNKPLLKQQAQPASKVLNKRVCDPQSNYLTTQSQTKKSTRISKSNNMNR
ncbi:hypothetical protein DSO57_1028120 [Entomophthora muscae]|uniref:Uncharacterized protein n=1 Tax=Entomophthora muscae TaxID=34485 RepID=A0ACC2UM58_9FUNG|nr:hypothetical protein DSO57_1028120 [Entomophthora muscae]